ncbi:hypothetical protein E1N52_29290 [Paraburkholderia guartelaensis]|uniref:Uncharacterized protein n=1 Tax=Paraburkholderia guartelaensis TaxID=2546446 RepID=A0A4R5L6T6_9BURK|nr:hypothetical protein [Paraburkholderia guartelaensis]TDG04540.1 hypothetical protein E1N52_29290 [Paraburkholderia guartelaensis]
MNDALKSADHAPRAREILLESGRTIWYMRLLLCGLLVIFVVLTIGMFYFGGAVLLGLIGLVFAGLIVAAAIRGGQEASRQARNRT